MEAVVASSSGWVEHEHSAQLTGPREAVSLELASLSKVENETV